MHRSAHATACLAGFTLLAGPQTAWAVNPVPFVETFSDSAGDGFDFTPFIDDTIGYNFAPNTGTDTFDVTLLDGARSYSTVETSGVPTTPGSVIEIGTLFTLTEGNIIPGVPDDATTRLGFSLFGSDGGNVEQSGPDPLSFSAYISEPGGFDVPAFVLRNVQSGDSIVSAPFTTFTGAMTGTTFDFDVDITLTATSMIADFTITDVNTPALVETGSVELVYSDPVLDAPTGTFFGYHIDKNSSGLPSTIVFDDFSLAVGGTAPLPGDANNDGTVDLLDFDVLAQNFGSNTGNGATDGDFNADGTVDLLDFDILAQNFGSSSPAALPGAVPEPAGLAMLGLGAAALLRGRRRRH
ncbi:MAG: dockerin type I domain-containing protein [Planctomycetota bacterium]